MSCLYSYKAYVTHKRPTQQCVNPYQPTTNVVVEIFRCENVSAIQAPYIRIIIRQNKVLLNMGNWMMYDVSVY